MFTATSVPAVPQNYALSGFWCTKANQNTIGPSLAAGSYTLDITSCHGLSLTGGPSPASYTLAPVGGAFVVKPAPLDITVSGTEACDGYYSCSTASFSADPPGDKPQPDPLPTGVQLSGYPAAPGTVGLNCSKIIGTPPSVNGSFDFNAISYIVDASSCTGLSLQGQNKADYTMVLIDGPFTITPPQPTPAA